MAEQVPSIGRMVHYVAYGTPGGEYAAGAHRAAMITEVTNGGPGIGIDSVGLVIFNPTGQFFNQRVPYDPTGTLPGTWHWAEYVPPREPPAPSVPRQLDEDDVPPGEST